jgi:hypothetical protein
MTRDRFAKIIHKENECYRIYIILCGENYTEKEVTLMFESITKFLKCDIIDVIGSLFKYWK